METTDTVEGRMEWLNEPASWQRTGDVLTVSVDPGTDFWRETGYGYIRDSGHVYGEVLSGDLDVSVRLHCVLEAQYDQAGVMLRADEQTWLKTGVEFFEGRPRLSTVLTLGKSSWMVTDLPGGSDDILLRVSRRGDAVEVRYLIGDGQAELAALVYLPPGRAVLAGVMCAAPEGSGFRVSFHDLQITERDWSAPAEEAGEWAGEPAWDSQEPAPGWDGGQAEGERRDWAMGPASEDHPSWPAGGVTAVDEPDWDADMPGADDPDWPRKLAMEEDPGWPPGAGTDAQAGPGGPAVGGQPAEPGDPPAGPEPDPPGEPAEQQTWTAAPTLEDAVADWDRLAAGVTQGRRTAAPAERWSAQTDANVATEWPGPPPRAARRTAISDSVTAADGPAAPADRDGPAAPADRDEPAAPAGDEPAAPANGKTAAPAEPGPPGSADEADEWISLLTADPAEE